MEIFGILIACCFCWFIVFITLNFYYDNTDKSKPQNSALKATWISFFIMLCLLLTAYCK